MEQEQPEERESHKANHLLLKKRSKGMPPPSNPNTVVESHPYLATHAQTQSEQQPNPTINNRQKGPLQIAFQHESRDIVDQHCSKMYLRKWVVFQCCSISILERDIEKC